MSVILSGCASFGQGIAEAVLEKSEGEDSRVCQVRGKPFAGIAPSLAKKHGKTKVLMVHGVGDRLAGYSTEFLEKLAKELDVAAKSSTYKDIQLVSPVQPEKNLGNLRITQLKNADGSKELLFYELTWSEITRAQKELLGFDNSGESSYKRAEVNDMMKKFGNDTGPDPIIYLGDSRVPILRAFSQSVCWMGKDGWEQLPTDSRVACTTKDSFSENTDRDAFVFISHSLGSRITIDGLQRLASVLENPKKYSTASYDLTPLPRMRQLLQQKNIQIFMLSNQLPMLQLGRELPEIAGQKADYCHANGARYGSRLFNQTNLIAFSDPNDLLSYAIPHNFSEKYLDSRLCINVTNVNINVAKIFDAFGLGKFANPMEAHLGYTKDDRVIAMIAKGIGNQQVAPLVKEKCEWTEITD
ncbi:MAG: hypothetical protein EXR80_07885 [Methylococcales bacterium]|nr:hypothetical protein [Methylococcales bacterium]